MPGRSRTLLRDGLIIDGTGRAPSVGSVLVEDGRIAEVGDLDRVEDAETIDAGGCAIAPGFIDVHSHADFTLLAFPTAESALYQGVTTVVVGNCGGGVAPIAEDQDFRRTAFAYRP